MRAASLRHFHRGAALVAALTFLTLILLSTGMLLRQVGTQQRSTRDVARKLQAHFLVESAVDRAMVKLARDRGYQSEQWTPEMGTTTDTATAKVAIEVKPAAEAGFFRVIVTAEYSDHPARSAKIAETRMIRLPAAN